MKLFSFQLKNIRCFEITAEIQLSSKINVFIGRNNSGKTTILSSILSAQQGFSVGGECMRPHTNDSAFMKFVFEWPDYQFSNNMGIGPGRKTISLLYNFDGTGGLPQGTHLLGAGSSAFISTRPDAVFEPFIARRKATSFRDVVNSSTANAVTGTLEHVYSRIDEVAVSEHPCHDIFSKALMDVLGFKITTRASANGKEAGFYFDRRNFVPLQKMGDGVSEIVALIVELCVAENRIFVIEEPETHLHPSGIKALMKLLAQSASNNQFIVSTHSNIVARELGGIAETKIFRVYKTGSAPSDPSTIEEIENNRESRQELLRELGYEFSDFDLFSGWLFLEESSAETVFNQILIPWFAPKLSGKLRTYAAGGVEKLEPSVDDFLRLMVFVHLSEAYNGKMFVRADGDPAGKQVLEKLKRKFSSMDETTLNIFSKEQFERYYPDRFMDEVNTVLAIDDKRTRQNAKTELLKKVLEWSLNNQEIAKTEWAKSAAEPIELLNQLANVIL
jgi:predicted ATPase